MALNQEQISGFEEAFRMFDKDNNGRITRSECYSFLQQLGQSCHDAETTTSHMLSQFDRNQSGTIDHKEFIRLMEQQAGATGSGGNADAEAGNEFAKYDTNRDGYICKDELKGLLQAHGAQKSDAEVDSMLREVDFDNDGKINYHEFVKACVL